MNEIESKILEIGHKSLERKIFSLGGKKVFDGEIIDIWMKNAENKEFRIRRKGNKMVIEHKKPISKSQGIKQAKETGFTTKSYKECIEFFREIGFEEVFKNTKTRVSYLLEDKDFGEIRFDFDDYQKLQGKQIPEFLEIEASNRQILIGIAEILGFKKSDLKDWGPKELLKYYS